MSVRVIWASRVVTARIHLGWPFPDHGPIRSMTNRPATWKKPDKLKDLTRAPLGQRTWLPYEEDLGLDGGTPQKSEN